MRNGHIEKQLLHVIQILIRHHLGWIKLSNKKHHHLSMFTQVDTQEHIQNFDSCYKTQLGEKSLADWQKLCEDMIRAKLAESNRE